MDTLIDYVKWMGQITFEHSPVNEIDNLVFCQISYYEIKDAFKENETLTLSECADRLDMDSLRVRVVGEEADRELYRDFFNEIVNAPRYKDIPISDHVDVTDDTVQFAAMTFHISDDEIYVAYRGTDDTLIGWKEDFMISFTEIPAQKMAVGYLDQVLMVNEAGTVYVGGHSKGGNLALYAVLNLQKEKWSRINRIYMNDSPGICSTVTDLSGLDTLRGKIKAIRPEFSVIGRLFEPDPVDVSIVKSSTGGIMQHMILSWGINHGKLLTAKDYSPESKWISETLDIWIENVVNESRKKLVDGLFDALGEKGAKTLSDLSKAGASGFEDILVKLIGSDAENRRTAAKLPEKALFGNNVEKVRENITLQSLLHSGLAQGIAAIIAGAMFLIIPQNNMMFVFMVVITAVVAFLICRTILRLYRSKWNLVQERTMVFITIIALVIYQFIFFKEHAMFLLSSIFFGIIFLAASYNCACMLRKKSDIKKWIKVRYAIEMVLFLVLGLFNLVSPEKTLETYGLSVGLILIFDGISRVIEYKQSQNK